MKKRMQQNYWFAINGKEKSMDYEDAIFASDISWNEITRYIKIPNHLYKYQCFQYQDESPNQYWKQNITGKFHMSLGCEFEDKNDCRPYFDKKFIIKYMSGFLYSLKVANKDIMKILKQITDSITDEYFSTVVNNYQKDIRIGCFTDLSDNNDMWQKYSVSKTGFCIEYETSKNKLFQTTVLPVLYTDKPYNSSLTIANSIILECCRQGKNRSTEENMEIFMPIYSKIIKTAYIPLFIKQEKPWGFEREYRMFLLKHRNTNDGLIVANDFLDDNYNIDLSQSISAIYIGENFDNNKNSGKLLEEVLLICKNKGFHLYRKVHQNGITVNKQLI